MSNLLLIKTVRFMEDSDFYLVRINGSDIVMTNINKKPCVRKCLSLAKRGIYVELWYLHSNVSVLVDYWN